MINRAPNVSRIHVIRMIDDLQEEDYKLFQASVEEILSGKSGAGDRQENGKELGAIIRDW